jgi:hypothetical protein
MKREKTFRRILFVFFLLAAAAAGFSEEEAKSTWAGSPARIDGMKTEWDSSVLNAHKKTKVDYAFMNDEKNLYILFVFKNPKYLSSIGFTGMNVWFNQSGKDEKDSGIKFLKKKITADEYIAFLESEIGTVPEEKKTQIRQNPSYIMFDHQVMTKDEESSKEGEAQRMKGVHYREGQLQKSVLFEFMIPLQGIAELAVDAGVEPGKSMNVGFEWGGATKEIKEAIASQTTAEKSKAQADRATSLKGERSKSVGDFGDLARMRRKLPKKYDFWVKLTLAQQ